MKPTLWFQILSRVTVYGTSSGPQHDIDDLPGLNIKYCFVLVLNDLARVWK